MMKKLVVPCILFILVAGFGFAATDNLTVKLTVGDQTAVSFTKDIYMSTSSTLNQDGFSIDEENSHYVPVVASSDGSSYKTDVFYASAKTNKADALEMYVTYNALSDKKGHTIDITVSSDKCYIDGVQQISSSSVVEGYENTIKLTEPSSNISGMRAVSHALVVSVADKDSYEAATEGNYTANLTLTTQLAQV